MQMHRHHCGASRPNHNYRCHRHTNFQVMKYFTENSFAKLISIIILILINL